MYRNSQIIEPHNPALKSLLIANPVSTGVIFFFPALVRRVGEDRPPGHPAGRTAAQPHAARAERARPTSSNNNKQSPRVLLGVMSNPVKPAMRAQQRKWAGHFQHAANVDVRFVLGTTFFNNTQRPPPEWDELKAEEKEHKDIIFVEGREKLPHVGVVTEKSASFWLSRGAESPGYEWYCKCDDDTLVHLSRLGETLANVTRSLGRTAHVYFGHLKWRGWEAGHRFQACGGGWGDSAKTLSDILGGGGMPDGSRYPPCPHAAGPVPYMSGGMACATRSGRRALVSQPALERTRTPLHSAVFSCIQRIRTPRTHALLSPRYRTRRSACRGPSPWRWRPTPPSETSTRPRASGTTAESRASVRSGAPRSRTPATCGTTRTRRRWSLPRTFPEPPLSLP